MPPIALANAAAAARLGLALALGLLVGFEREWSNKDAGIRTCAIAALMGVLTAQVSPALAVTGMAGVLVLVVFLNLHALRENQSVEITTSAALILVYVMGVLVGRGAVFMPLAAAVATTLLLAWKLELHRFAGAVQLSEIRGAVWIAVLAFVIYPLLPNRAVDRWGLINPHTVWVAVIVVAAISFANYVLMRLYSARGLVYSAVLGGLVNSAATILDLGASLRELGGSLLPMGITVTLLATVAMLARNLLLLALFAPPALKAALAPMLVLVIAGTLLAWRWARDPQPSAGPLRLASPLSLRRVLEFGGLFLLIDVATALGERAWGSVGVYAAAIAGGVFNSAGATVAVATLAAQHSLTAETAGIATVLASIAATLGNAMLMNRVLKQPRLGRINLLLAGAISAAAAITLVVQSHHL